MIMNGSITQTAVRRDDGLELSALVMALLFTMNGGCDSSDSQPSDGNLSPQMSDLQQYTEKLGYAINAQNNVLADFYLDEVEQTVARIRNRFPQYEGRSIASLAETLTVPKIEPLRTALNGSDWSQARSAYGSLVDSCNACHQATFREFIHIEQPTGDPPWSQRFTPEQ